MGTVLNLFRILLVREACFGDRTLELITHINYSKLHTDMMHDSKHF